MNARQRQIDSDENHHVGWVMSEYVMPIQGIISMINSSEVALQTQPTPSAKDYFAFSF